MAKEFRLPDIGEGLTEAEVVRWLVPEGGRVEMDQPVVEVETDKAVVEIPSPYGGVVVRHGAPAGATVAVGQVLVVIEDENPTPVEPAPTGSAAPIVGTLTEDAEDLTVSGVKALPLVRKLARDLGVDLSRIRGSGPEGRITREDVMAASGDAATPQERPGPIESEGGGDRRQPMSRLRRTIAANMSRSWAEVPHVTTFDDVDATRLLETRAALAGRHGTKIPLEALVVKAILPALVEFPEFNATVDGDDLILRGPHHVGVAVDTEEGLMVAVIRQAERLGVLELAAEVIRLGEGARARKLSPDELTGQTFTISNIGAVGGGHGTPIVPPGTTAILSLGRARMKPVVIGDDLGIAPLMPLSLSYDHRVIDGAQGRRFMTLVMENLEEPALFLAG